MTGDLAPSLPRPPQAGFSDSGAELAGVGAGEVADAVAVDIDADGVGIVPILWLGDQGREAFAENVFVDGGGAGGADRRLVVGLADDRDPLDLRRWKRGLLLGAEEE
jgi:hypothetical protein